MNEQLNMLIQLQEVDRKARALADQKKKLPAALAELERRRGENAAGIETAREALQSAQKSKRDRDKDLEDGAQKVEKLKARTSEIKNNKEYQALLKEIETAELESKKIEEDILVLMEKIDAATAGIGQAEERAKQEEAALQAEQQQHEAEYAQVETELTAVEAERQAMMGRIDSGILGQYQRLLGTKAGIAIAEARGEACSGCYMSIPPQVFVNVKKNESIITCPHCGRILYFKELIEQKNP
jgi:predicted  nucleic acid-binding Zn-ribbon protein